MFVKFVGVHDLEFKKRCNLWMKSKKQHLINMEIANIVIDDDIGMESDENATDEEAEDEDTATRT